MRETMLTASSVSKTYGSPSGEVTALDAQDLEIHPGERVGLIGPSGCGKSTLGRILALLEPPDTGRVTLDGQPITVHGLRVPGALRRRIQLIWQSPRLSTDPRMRLCDVFLEPLVASRTAPRSRQERMALAQRWADRVGLTTDLLTRHPHEVSDGQLQRACLARALILRPSYLIADESTSMLDVSTQASLLSTVAQAQHDTDLAVLLISHDQTLVEHWCHRTVRMPGPVDEGGGSRPSDDGPANGGSQSLDAAQTTAAPPHR